MSRSYEILNIGPGNQNQSSARTTIAEPNSNTMCILLIKIFNSIVDSIVGKSISAHINIYLNGHI